MAQGQSRGWVKEDDFQANKEANIKEAMEKSGKTFTGLETRIITGQELIDIYTGQNDKYQRIVKGRESQKEYINSIPAEQEKPNEATGEMFTVTREMELRRIALREATSVITKGEFKKVLALSKEFKANMAVQPLSEEHKAAYEKTLTRIASMNKFARHPNQAAEMKRLQEYCYDKNCTEKGIDATIAETTAKININNEMISKIKGLENETFTINIKHDKALGSLRLDENFGKQLDTAIDAKKVVEKAVEKPARGKAKDKSATPAI